MPIDVSRRRFLQTAAAGSALMPFAGMAAGARKPNFVIIMADDLGYGDIGCYGNQRYQTPNLDRLAGQGMQFTDFHANGAVCTPTRAALLTGRYQQRCGLEGVIYVRGETRQVGLAQSELTFAETLKSAGYATGIFGKWHLGYNKPFNPVHQGFDEFKGYVSGNIDYHSHYDNAGIFDWWHNTEKVKEDGYVTDLLTDHALNFIENNQDNPFCVYIAHEAPHWPYQGRDDPADRFPDTDFDSHGSREDRAGAYQEMVEVMDENIGRVLRKLQALQLENDTLVFFCSDNGAVPKLGNNGGLRGDKASLWEGGHRVPAIAYWPGRIEAGAVNDETVMSMDLFPTMASLAGARVPEGHALDGADLSPVLFAQQALPERTLFWRYRKQTAVRRGEYKLLIHDGKPHLFDLANDRQEQHNLIDSKPAIAEALQTRLSAWEAEINAIPQKTT